MSACVLCYVFSLDWSTCGIDAITLKLVTLEKLSISRMKSGCGRSDGYFPSIIVAGSPSQKKAYARMEMVAERAETC